MSPDTFFPLVLCKLFAMSVLQKVGDLIPNNQTFEVFFGKKSRLCHVYWLWCAYVRLRQLHLTSLLSSRGNSSWKQQNLKADHEPSEKLVFFLFFNILPDWSPMVTQHWWKIDLNDILWWSDLLLQSKVWTRVNSVKTNCCCFEWLAIFLHFFGLPTYFDSTKKKVSNCSFFY